MTERLQVVSQNGRNRAIRLVTAGVAAGVVLIAAGCSSSGSGGGSPSQPASGGGTTSSGAKVGVSLILKTLTNPYFVTMEKDAEAAAAKDNVNLTVAAGKQDGDTQTQITAIDNAISRGDKGILITTNGNAVNAALNQAKKAGLFVIALDTAPNPPSVADITYATDNTPGRQARRPVRGGGARRQAGRHRHARPVQQPGRLGRHRP